MNPGASAMPPTISHVSIEPIYSSSSAIQGSANHKETPSHAVAITRAQPKPRMPSEPGTAPNGRECTGSTSSMRMAWPVSSGAAGISRQRQSNIVRKLNFGVTPSLLTLSILRPSTPSTIPKWRCSAAIRCRFIAHRKRSSAREHKCQSTGADRKRSPKPDMFCCVSNPSRPMVSVRVG